MIKVLIKNELETSPFQIFIRHYIVKFYKYFAQQIKCVFSLNHKLLLINFKEHYRASEGYGNSDDAR